MLKHVAIPTKPDESGFSAEPAGIVNTVSKKSSTPTIQAKWYWPLATSHCIRLARRLCLLSPILSTKPNRLRSQKCILIPKTCDLRVFERFIPYLLNYPPKWGIPSVQVFYRGELADLGANLKNTLQNTFARVERMRWMKLLSFVRLERCWREHLWEIMWLVLGGKTYDPRKTSLDEKGD